MNKIEIYNMINKNKRKVKPTLLSIFDSTKELHMMPNFCSNGAIIIKKDENIIKETDIEKLKSRKNYMVRYIDTDYFKIPAIKTDIKDKEKISSIEEKMTFVKINGNNKYVFNGNYFRFLKKYRDEIYTVKNNMMLLFYKNNEIIGSLMPIRIAKPETLNNDMTVEEYNEFKKTLKKK